MHKSTKELIMKLSYIFVAICAIAVPIVLFRAVRRWYQKRKCPKCQLPYKLDKETLFSNEAGKNFKTTTITCRDCDFFQVIRMDNGKQKAIV
ncbi:MAG TPA: hypothetical protein VHQ20_00440 [Patescibacteria group bacterium]|jgi:RNase P subunit RPR2|nr:hypothetical protein [Patescibacteria group bacterium]